MEWISEKAKQLSPCPVAEGETFTMGMDAFFSKGLPFLWDKKYRNVFGNKKRIQSLNEYNVISVCLKKSFLQGKFDIFNVPFNF